jgi:HPt (histidine-containing phosphotransfer) domain-containing protein
MAYPPSPEDRNRRPPSRNQEDQESRQQKIQSMLAGIWERSKTTVVQRVEILREARTAAGKGQLDEPARLRAVDAAHKLAGVLGTFGLPRGTELAREAEETFGKIKTLSRADFERLGIILDELEYLVRTADPYYRPDPF